MPMRLDSASPSFAEAFEALLGSKREASADVNDTVAGIIADVRARGDAALVELTNRFDRQSELAGVCFSPDGSTMFVNIYWPGVTLAITGPWRSYRA